MSALPVTSTIAACLAVIMLPLTLQVSMRRKSIGNVVFGDAGDEVLRRRIRAFGNFIEYVPTCLMLLALVEIGGGSPILLWSIGGLLLLGRIIHALGMLYAETPVPRAIAMFMTYAAFLMPAVWLLMDVWS
jgi:hypothetical protein